MIHDRDDGVGSVGLVIYNPRGWKIVLRETEFPRGEFSSRTYDRESCQIPSVHLPRPTREPSGDTDPSVAFIEIHPVSDSTRDPLPIHEEPTQPLERGEAGELSGDALDSMWLAGDEPGETLEVPRRLGDYEIVRLLGAGGMGRVFLAEHTRMGRTVALKMLPAERMTDPVAVERFYEEVRAASRLMHPNIVTAFDAGESAGIHFFAMEFVDGQTLTDLVSQKGPLSVGEAASVIRQASLGLLHSHRAGIVHRDVKPGNLMRAGDGTIKVLDLGLARLGQLGGGDGATGGPSAKSRRGGRRNRGDAADPPPQAGRLVGTLPFMSPEQLEDPESADARSDIYSLGATLFFLLTGRPPFTGDFLEQVYGHRHGEIPDLMQLREDVDLRFSHIFSRMLAKSADERYASLDEVLEDLAPYAEESSAPAWLADFARRSLVGDVSTVHSGSTHGRTAKVLGIDFGMFYAAAAEAGVGGEIRSLSAGEGEEPLLRLAVANDKDRLAFAGEAIALRSHQPDRVAHCLPMYLGQSMLHRRIGGELYPPEVWMALLLRRITKNAWTHDEPPDALALTVPASYDQLHRRCLVRAATMAGFRSIRLVDRCLATVQSRRLPPTWSENSDQEDAVPGIAMDGDETILFVGLTGQATEVAVIRQVAARLEALSTAGHWNHGTLGWLQRLVDLAAERFLAAHGFDPRQRLTWASRLQLACERAMNAMLLQTSVDVRLRRGEREFVVRLRRDDWLSRCEDRIARIRQTIAMACRDAGIDPAQIRRCVLLGPLLRLPEIRRDVLADLPGQPPWESVDRSDAARGAAACLAAELPGRADWLIPPKAIASQSIGILVEDNQRRRRILPLVPRRTLLPARTNRRLTIASDRQEMTLSIVESAGLEGEEWHSLGRYDFSSQTESSQDAARSGAATAKTGATLSPPTRSKTRNISFEVDVNGLLTVRTQTPGMPGSRKLDSLPTPPYGDEKVAAWTRWVEESIR